MFWDVWNEETVALGGYMSAAHESCAHGHLTFPSQITWMIYHHFTPNVVKIVPPPTLLSSHAPFSGIPHVKGKQQNPTSSYTPVAHHVPTILRGSSPRWHHEPSAEEEMWVPGVIKGKVCCTTRWQFLKCITGSHSNGKWQACMWLHM